MKFYESIEKQLESLQGRDQFRSLCNIEYDADGKAYVNGRQMLNLSSNDYLGLASDMDLKREFLEKISSDPLNSSYSLAAGSSRLLTGNHIGYERLEKLISDMFGGRSALVFNSGYHANVGLLPALAGRGDLVLSDKLNHASIIDGATLAGAKFKRYRHLDNDHLAEMLAKNSNKYRHIFIITESVFSMDGDVADLKRMVELKKQYDAVLIVDEAHGFGVFGEKGCGVCEAQGVINDVDVIVSTFGKAACSMGSAAVMDSCLKDFLINKMRSLIFTTALPPLTIAWTNYIIEKLVGMADKREHLANISAKLRNAITDNNMQTCGESQVVPLIIGENVPTLEMADKFREAGILVFAIRPPTVPFNTARLRFSLNAGITSEEIDQVIANL